MQLQKGRAAQEHGLQEFGQQAFVAILAIQQRRIVWVVHAPIQVLRRKESVVRVRMQARQRQQRVWVAVPIPVRRHRLLVDRAPTIVKTVLQRALVHVPILAS